jgi:hypothetical protein
MLADATIVIKNDFPLNLILPSLNFDIKVDGCQEFQPKITLANATVQSTHIFPKEDITVNSTGYIYQPSESLTSQCPGTGKSPLDTLLGGYIRGHEVTLYIGGSPDQSPQTPQWLTDILAGFTLPVPITGHSFENVIKNFTLADIKFDLPDPYADPDSPESNPMISGNIETFITLPEEMNFKVDVQRIRATADVLYKKKKLGELDLQKWQPASSKQINDTDSTPLLFITSDIEKAPLNITDQDVFSYVIWFQTRNAQDQS